MSDNLRNEWQKCPLKLDENNVKRIIMKKGDLTKKGDYNEKRGSPYGDTLHSLLETLWL